MAEFSKGVLDFSACLAGSPTGKGAAREFVSSKGVRNLTRGFVFAGQEVFGTLGGKNASDDDKTSRIESIEVGQLLGLWKLADQDDVQENRFIDELLETDNCDGGHRLRELQGAISQSLRSNSLFQEELIDFIYRRGHERLSLSSGKPLWEI